MSAKAIHIAPINKGDADAVIRRIHYSGKIVPNSQLHFGVYYHDRLEGVMQFGPPINKKGTLRLVAGTAWNGMLELNRMAFSETLPRNSESRALAIALKLIRKHYAHVEWILSFADATRCGDGAIYRAAGFVLTDIRKNEALRMNPVTGEVMHIIQAHHKTISKQWRTWPTVNGFQLRYMYFLNPAARERLQVPILPYARIYDAGAGMYKGMKRGK